MTYDFTDKYKIGIEEVDKEHEQFFAYINEGVKALDATDEESIIIAKSLLKKLTVYAETHLVNEEAYMRRTKDALLLTQMHLHNEFRDKLKKLLNKENMTKKDVGDVFVFMASWLSNHIQNVDTKIGQNRGKSVFTMTENFLTGIEVIDDEHRQLFDIISRAYEVMEDEFLVDKYDAIVTILKELKEYTILHFSDEEAYMEKIGYAGLAGQKKLHDAFVEKLTELDFEDMETIDDDQSVFLSDLMDFLTEWLVEHILKVDRLIPS